LTGNGKKNINLAITRNKFPFELGTWIHLSVVFDGKMIKLYFNGLPATEKETVITPGGAYELSIGSFAKGYAYGFIGAISDLKIYASALPDEAILAEAQEISK
jgi:hypothetical protein